MFSYPGIISLPDGRAFRGEVTVSDVDAALHVGGNEIGRWPRDGILVERSAENTFRVAVGGDTFQFAPADPAGFGRDVAGEIPEETQESEAESEAEGGMFGVIRARVSELPLTPAHWGAVAGAFVLLIVLVASLGGGEDPVEVTPPTVEELGSTTTTTEPPTIGVLDRPIFEFSEVWNTTSSELGASVPILVTLTEEFQEIELAEGVYITGRVGEDGTPTSVQVWVEVTEAKVADALVAWGVLIEAVDPDIERRADVLDALGISPSDIDVKDLPARAEVRGFTYRLEFLEVVSQIVFSVEE